MVTSVKYSHFLCTAAGPASSQSFAGSFDPLLENLDGKQLLQLKGSQYPALSAGYNPGRKMLEKLFDEGESAV